MSTESLDEALEPFIDDGLIEGVLYQVKSGKEATVFCCRAGPRLDAELVAAKVYKSHAFRSFRDDAIYREGRVIVNKRSARAAAKQSRFGQEVRSSLWTNHEWESLSMLYAAGSDVPRPLAHTAEVILLEFVGDAQGAAPMLRNVDLTRARAEQVFDCLLENIQLWLAWNVVHGDLSPYNVLYRAEGNPVVIDFPQACDPRSNSNAFRLLARDIENLARFFMRFGAHRDAYALAERYWSVWERP